MKLLHMGNSDIKPMDYENNNIMIAGSIEKPKGLWMAQLIDGKSDWIDFAKEYEITKNLIDGSILEIKDASKIYEVNTLEDFRNMLDKYPTWDTLSRDYDGIHVTKDAIFDANFHSDKSFRVLEVFDIDSYCFFNTSPLIQTGIYKDGQITELEKPKSLQIEHSEKKPSIFTDKRLFNGKRKKDDNWIDVRETIGNIDLKMKQRNEHTFDFIGIKQDEQNQYRLLGGTIDLNNLSKEEILNTVFKKGFLWSELKIHDFLDYENSKVDNEDLAVMCFCSNNLETYSIEAMTYSNKNALLSEIEKMGKMDELLEYLEETEIKQELPFEDILNNAIERLEWKYDCQIILKENDVEIINEYMEKINSAELMLNKEYTRLAAELEELENLLKDNKEHIIEKNIDDFTR